MALPAFNFEISLKLVNVSSKTTCNYENETVIDFYKTKGLGITYGTDPAAYHYILPHILGICFIEFANFDSSQENHSISAICIGSYTMGLL